MIKVSELCAAFKAVSKMKHPYTQYYLKQQEGALEVIGHCGISAIKVAVKSPQNAPFSVNITTVFEGLGSYLKSLTCDYVFVMLDEKQLSIVTENSIKGFEVTLQELDYNLGVCNSSFNLSKDVIDAINFAKKFSIGDLRFIGIDKSCIYGNDKLIMYRYKAEQHLPASLLLYSDFVDIPFDTCTLSIYENFVEFTNGITVLTVSKYYRAVFPKYEMYVPLTASYACEVDLSNPDILKFVSDHTYSKKLKDTRKPDYIKLSSFGGTLKLSHMIAEYDRLACVQPTNTTLLVTTAFDYEDVTCNSMCLYWALKNGYAKAIFTKSVIKNYQHGAAIFEKSSNDQILIQPITIN